ncbi:MAG: efflux RND transporter periplasmic adaptor subunit [Burkholderiales bacterium]
MKKKLLIIGIVILVFSGVWSLLARKGSSVAAPKVATSILLNQSDLVKVERGVVENSIGFTGDLAPLNQAVISSEIDAQVLKVMVNEGQLVTKDQVLAILDDTELKQAVSQQRAILASNKAKFRLDKNKLERQKDLLAQGFISKFAYEELQTNYQASLEAIKQQQAALKQAQKQLSTTVIKAPFTGYIYHKYIDTGQLASKNGKLFSLASLDHMQIKAAIPSDQINDVQPNQLVTFKVETSKQIYQGKVSRINPVAETGTRSYMIYVDFDNRRYQLKAGQFVKGQIILTQLANVTYLPREAIRQGSAGSYVLVMAKNKVLAKPVTILLTSMTAGFSAVSGVESGEVVLAGNVSMVKVGDAIKIVD